MRVKNGDTIKIEYSRSLDDGTELDQKGEVVATDFVVGQGMVVPGLDQAVVGMALNETKEVRLCAHEAYGESSSDLIRNIPLDILPEKFVPQKGMVLTIQHQSGEPAPGTVVDITDRYIVLDLNHPLAGKSIVCKVTILAICASD